LRKSPPQTARTTPQPAAALRGRQRRRLDVRGLVQGVGFRPFVYRLATELGLGGCVGNDMRGAFIEIEGSPAALDAFGARVCAELPPMASIVELLQSELPVVGESAFRIESSVAAGPQEAQIAPDAATCGDCLRELLDPGDRRHGYPFINCTNCGPRYSIIRSVPYDRPNTTMSAFTMCSACQAEYDDPASRRFHAQPNACPICGPRVWLVDAAGGAVAGDPTARTAELLTAGRIVAIKGIGGFHMACRADSDEAVLALRQRKGRDSKPLAIMVAGLAEARLCAEVDAASAEAMAGPERPIVLVKRRKGGPVSAHVAPGCGTLGIMLAYTPLHVLLLARGVGPLVMTSGNPSDEPLCRDNDEALARLAGVADAFLLHDRDIERRIDDSVVMAPVAEGGCAAATFPIRRARGYVPAPIAVPVHSKQCVLAVGGELKSTICLLAGGAAVVSEHLGELPHPATYRNFLGTVELFKRLLRLEPDVLACDLHPSYITAHWARAAGLPVEAVQHHHAHVVSCMADSGIAGQVIGIACDGTGYGSDGAIWGGEVLVCDESDFTRAAHLRYYPLPGGDAAAIETWRPAAGLLHETLGSDWPETARAFERVEREALALTAARLSRGARMPLTSSLGRVFDAAAFLLGLCDRNGHEGQAAMALEAAAAAADGADPLPYNVALGPDGALLLDVRPALARVVADLAAGRSAGELARAFHETVAAVLAAVAVQVAGKARLDRVCLTGGCMVNRLLLSGLSARLRRAGLTVFVHRQVPPGDGGLALGQAVAAGKRIANCQLQIAD
jgi:hydrogenase maturation protein HypF